MKVTIKDKEYDIRFSLRVLFKYEEVCGHPFEGKRLQELYMLMHCALLALNEDYTLTFDELIDYCDDDKSVFETFQLVLNDSQKRDQGKKKRGNVDKPVSVVSLYEEIVGRGGVSPAYFFDCMTFSECAIFLRGMRRKERTELERVRLLMWSVFQSQSRRRLDVEDVLRLDDERETSDEAERINEEEMKELRKRAKNIKL